MVAFTIMSVVLIILAVCLIVFSTMSVACDENSLEVRIGFLIRKRFSLGDVVSCKAIKIPWYYGWGIRMTPKGWLYRVSGSHVVEINMKDGRQYLIGTDEPDKLASFINEQLPGKVGE
jgi:hypothetical protein